MELKEVLESDRGRWAIVSIAVVVILVAVIVYLLLLGGRKCGDYSCFKDSMASCSKAEYINEMPEASWGYTVLGSSNGQCTIRVKLLQAKQGVIDMTQLGGYYMDCSYPIGISTYPESDLSKCHGRLREELQNVVIKKLYAYIIENIGQVGESLRNAV